MSGGQSEPRDVREHYATQQQDYVDQYDPEKIRTRAEYPANFFRLALLKRRFAELRPGRILDAGAGSGVPLLRLAEHVGTNDAVAFDVTPDMVQALQAAFHARGWDAARTYAGDVDRAEPYDRALAQGGPFDAVLMLGVMPHVQDETAVLRQVRRVLKPGGRAFVSFRNKLFNLLTMNRYTHDFLVEEVLADAPEPVRRARADELAARLAMDKPPIRTVSSTGSVGYDLIKSSMHNPLEMPALFRAAGFGATRLHWYHFHATLPMLEGARIDRAAFREASMALEGSDDWRGHILCSAYVVEAEA